MSEENEKNEGNKLRDISEVLFAHDVIDQFVSGRLPLVPTKEEQAIWIGCMVALCWMLGHDFGSKLSENIEQLLAECEKQGFNWVDVSDLETHNYSN